jgi:hypothetical protein
MEMLTYGIIQSLKTCEAPKVMGLGVMLVWTRENNIGSEEFKELLDANT